MKKRRIVTSHIGAFFLKKLLLKYFRITILEMTFYCNRNSTFQEFSFLACFNETLLKMMKNAFPFTLKALFFLKIFKFFVLTYWLCRKNCFIRKIKFLSKFVASQPVTSICNTHVAQFPMKYKGNQKIKFSQLLEYNRRNIFHQK